MDPRRWEAIQSAFDELVELDATERARRLTSIDRANPDLHRALESLLAADAESSTKLVSFEAGLPSRSENDLDPLGLVGRTISHFEVRQLIGAGGMGVVYRADDTRLSRPVALKFLLPVYNLDAAARTRFLHEAHSVAALDHPNLCSIYEVGTSDDGRLFLAMALYRGETLKTRLDREGPLPVSQATEIARQIAEGLRSAHAAGVIHRDLKPANVMLLPGGTLKILDFGLAKARDQSLSNTGARFGTVSYMAPEQIQGAAVDACTDLWALGVMLYEMLTGRKPFSGDEEVAIAHAILHNELDLPSTRRGDLSTAFEDVVLKLLRKEPVARYAQASELLDDLARIQTAGRYASMRRHWRRVWHAVPKTRRLTLATFALLLATVGALGYASIARQGNHAPIIAPRTAIAVLPFRNLSSEGSFSYFAGGLQDEILTRLSMVPTLKVTGRASATGYHDPELSALRQIASELGVRTVVRGSVQEGPRGLRVDVAVIDASSGVSLWSHTYDEDAEQLFEVQTDIVQQIVAAVGEQLSNGEFQRLAHPPTSRGETYRLYLQGREYLNRPGKTWQNLEFAKLLFDKAIKFDAGFALARAARSQLFGSMYQLTAPPVTEHGLRQREDAEAALRLAPDLPQAHVAMGMAHLFGYHRDPVAALEEFTIARIGLPSDADVWGQIAQAQRSLGRWNDAAQAFERARELDPRNWALLHLLGITQMYLRRYTEAVRAFDRAAGIAAGDPAALVPIAVEKGRAYLLWRGQFDTLRTALRDVPKEAAGPVTDAEHLQLLFWERRSDSLLAVLRSAQPSMLVSASFFWPTSLLAAWTHQLHRDMPAARAAFDSALALVDTIIVIDNEPDPDGRFHAARGLALAGLGRRDEALRDARWLEQAARSQQEASVRLTLQESRARVLAHAGYVDDAITEIEQLLALPSLMSVHTLRHDPLWDPIRRYPRFRAILARYGY